MVLVFAKDLYNLFLFRCLKYSISLLRILCSYTWACLCLRLTNIDGTRALL